MKIINSNKKLFFNDNLLKFYIISIDSLTTDDDDDDEMRSPQQSCSIELAIPSFLPKRVPAI